jgi:hypothetical protein
MINIYESVANRSVSKELVTQKVSATNQGLANI